MKTKSITLTRLPNRSEGEQDPGLRRRFASLAEQVNSQYRTLYGGAETGADAIVLLDVIGEFLIVMEQLDEEYGSEGPLPIEDAVEATEQALRCLAELDTWLGRLNLPALRSDLQTIVLGVGWWAMRHECAILTAAPIINALAERANDATSKQEVAAIYGMMQGFIEFFFPLLGADLERSDPMRPWRLLNLNFAIAGLRTGDEMLMRFAFDKLNDHLPDDRAGFYAEALQIAESAELPQDIQAIIRWQMRKWTSVH